MMAHMTAAPIRAIPIKGGRIDEEAKYIDQTAYLEAVCSLVDICFAD